MSHLNFSIRRPKANARTRAYNPRAALYSSPWFEPWTMITVAAVAITVFAVVWYV